MRQIDPEKLITENYPELEFIVAHESLLSLDNVEDEVLLSTLDKLEEQIFIWKYAYYFVSLVIPHSKLDRTYSVIVALYTEALNSLRSAFILNVRGYHSDGIVLLRKCHEDLVRAVAITKNPLKTDIILSSTDIGKAEHSFGVGLRELYKLESSFTHSNKLKTYKSLVDTYSANDQVRVEYGPQDNHQLFLVNLRISIFWMYFMIKVVPTIFPNQISDYWHSKKEISAEMLRTYIQNSKAKTLIQSCDIVDSSLVSK